MKLRLLQLGMVAAVTTALFGCGGGGDDGAPGAAGTSTTTVVTSPGVQISSLTTAQMAALQMQGKVDGVIINSPPEVTFTVTDASGNAIVGLEKNYSQATGATVPTQRTVTATIAKFVPGTNNSPGKWVNYLVTAVSSTNGSTTGLGAPTTDANGTLTYLGNGQYKYTFLRDITKIADYVSSSTSTFKADVGDVSYQPNLLHRMVVQIGGAVRGTGNNTADGSTLTAAVNMENPLNLVYDFIPATGQQVVDGTQSREIVKIESCNECHSKLGFHGGSARVDTKMCVTCHTNQRKYGQTAASLTTTKVVQSDGTLATEPAWSTEPRKFPNGDSFRDFPIMIHGIHRGEYLPVKMMQFDASGNITSSDYVDEVKYPQPITNCTKCHDGSATAKNKTALGDNWKNAPSRAACSACHNNMDFATGANHPAPGGIRTDDSTCKECHSANDISKVYHVSVDPTGGSGRAGYPLNTAQDVPTPGYPSGQGPAIPLASLKNPPAGVYKIGLELSKVTVASNKATVVYRVLKDGSPVTFQSSGYLMDGVNGTPSIYVTWGLPEDGVAKVADWTASISATVLQCRNQVATACTQSGPDANGWYTAKLAGTVPTGAQKINAELGINYDGFVQLNNPDFPKGIRLREPAFAILAATSVNGTAVTDQGRRSIVSAAKCNNCHDQLGVEPSFHGGARNNPQGCATGGCHNQTKSTGHVGATYSYGGGWSLSAKNMVHAIHGSSKRSAAFNYEASIGNPKGMGSIGYPGKLNNCEQCHVPGSYDFSGSQNTTDFANLLWSTDANGNMTNTTGTSLGQSPWIKLLGAGEVDYRGDPLVSSPLTSTCFGCHDSQTARLHMAQNGGRLLQRVSAITGATPGVPGTSTTDRSGLTAKNTETCMVCHATGKVADIKVVHKVK